MAIKFSNPLCSVVIPAYNCEQFIAQAINSVLNQTYNNIEVIVIDDNSTDSTFDIICMLKATDTRIRMEKTPYNMGVAEARQLGFSLANGKYIALLDGDDTWTNTKLQIQISKLEKSGADICCCAYQLMDKNANLIGKCVVPPNVPSFKHLLKQNYIGCSTTVFRHEISDKTHMRNDFAHEDYVFWLECMQAGFKLITIMEPLVQYRVLNGSRSANKFKAAKNRWKIYRIFLGFSFFKSLYYFLWYIFYAFTKWI